MDHFTVAGRYLVGLMLGVLVACGAHRDADDTPGQPGGAGTNSGSSSTNNGGTAAVAPGTSMAAQSGTANSCPSYGTDSIGNRIIAATEANNYHFSSRISIRSVTVKPNSELSFDWSGVTRDITGHAVDPEKDIGMVMVLLWNRTKQQLEDRINNDEEIMSADLAAGASIFTHNAMTAGTLRDMEIVTGGPIRWEDLQTYFDDRIFDPATHTYTVMVSSGSTPGEGIRSIQAFSLDPNSTNTQVISDSNSNQLTYVVDLHSQPPVLIPPGKSNLVVDWTNLVGLTNALGRQFDDYSISTARIASFLQSPAELEAKFLDLTSIATGLWEAEVESKTSVSFASFMDADGRAFPGIDTTQTWLLALQCGRCGNPAPWYIMILAPCAD